MCLFVDNTFRREILLPYSELKVTENLQNLRIAWRLWRVRSDDVSRAAIRKFQILMLLQAGQRRKVPQNQISSKSAQLARYIRYEMTRHKTVFYLIILQSLRHAKNLRRS